MILGTAGLVILVPKGRMHPPATTMIPFTEHKINTAAQALWASHASESTGKERSYCSG